MLKLIHAHMCNRPEIEGSIELFSNFQSKWFLHHESWFSELMESNEIYFSNIIRLLVKSSIFIQRFSQNRLHQSSLVSSKHNDIVCLLVEKYPHLVELINGINDWLFNLNIPKEPKNSFK